MNKLILASLALAPLATTAKTKKPNVVYILADDLGIGDLGCYGQKIISTPNIDRLAKQGLLFENHYSGSTVSAPSRSSLMTGLHTGHTPVRGNKEIKPEGQKPLPDSLMTMAKLFKSAGYTTATFGKWGLGFPGSTGDPNNQGFDEFYGYNCQRLAHKYYPTHLWHNQTKVVLEGNENFANKIYAPDLIQEKTLEFIASNKNHPFFIYVPIVQPHAELLVPEDSVFERYREQIKDENPYKGNDWGYASQQYPRAAFAAMVDRVDRYVGEIIEELKKHGLMENTLIIFTSDNGAHREGGADPDFFDSNGPYRGYKRDLSDGGIHVPMIARWDGVIDAGRRSQHIGAFWDMLPTFADILGVKLNQQSDGLSILRELQGKRGQKEHDFLYWEATEGAGAMAVRMGDYKAIVRGLNKDKNAPIELYNVVEDVTESVNLADSHPELVERARMIMSEQHTKSDDFPFAWEN